VALVRHRDVLTRWRSEPSPDDLRLDEDTVAALDACTDAVIGIDDQGVCVLVNAATATMFGYPRAELVGMGAHLLLPTLGHVVTETAARRRSTPSRTGQRVEPRVETAVEAIGVRRDGGHFPAQVTVRPAYPDRSRLTLYTTVHDLSAQRSAAAAHRALLEEVNLLRDTVSAMGAAAADRAILVLDQQGHILSMNRGGEKLLGCLARDILGKPLAVLSDPADLAAVRQELGVPDGLDPLLELTRSGLPNQQNWTLLGKDGERRPVSMSIVAINGDAAGATTGGTGGFIVAACERKPGWEPLMPARSTRLLLDLDNAQTRTLRWQVGGSGVGRGR
jgi:PAS domain S-box-containing protein